MSKIDGKLSENEWLDKIYELKHQKEPFYYSHDALGSPKYENGILVLFERGLSPLEALKYWKKNGTR